MEYIEDIIQKRMNGGSYDVDDLKGFCYKVRYSKTSFLLTALNQFEEHQVKSLLCDYIKAECEFEEDEEKEILEFINSVNWL